MVMLLMPSLSGLIQDVVTKALNNQVTFQTNTTCKGKGKTREQPLDDEWKDYFNHLILSDKDNDGYGMELRLVF